jgi:hypothetical protein
MALTNAPRIVRGAFVEWGLSLPVLLVGFQFNPVELVRSRSLSFAPENSAVDGTLRDFHQELANLADIQRRQTVRVQEESVSFDIRLDATDKLEEGDRVAVRQGVLPQLAALELMVQPKSDRVLGGRLAALLGRDEQDVNFAKSPNPPMILFIWGRKRVLPVNINAMNVRETEFNTMLDPIRATVSVNLTVIEGPNRFAMASRLSQEESSVLNIPGIAHVANVAIPG